MARYKTKWTIVQHSAAGYGGNLAFALGVEERGIESQADENMILKAGGVVFDDYLDAVKFEEKVNGITDPEHDSLYPNAKGTFSDKLYDGLKIYIPVREIVG
jgi:hypothetical protein